MTAKDIMTTQVMTVQPTSTIHDALTLMVQIEISGLIVTEEDGTIVGVVTERDLLVAYDFLKQTKAPITDYISRDVVGVTEDTPIEEVNKILMQGNVRRVPVLKDNQVVGVISRRDLLKQILDQEKSS